MKIAVVHDYFTQLGGAEMVAQELVRMLPGANLFSTVALPHCMPAGLRGMAVETTWMQMLPKMEQYYRLYFLLYPFAVQSLDLSDYELVISSSSGYAKGVRASPEAMHVCYCHNPMRWAWSFDSYSAREALGPLKRMLLPHMIGALRSWDKGASRQPDHFVANSKTVAARIERAYGRTAQVIHPPIDLNRFRPSKDRADYYLVLSRLVSYKQIDIAVEACTRLKRELIVIGDGPDSPRLKAMAGPMVTFLGRLADSEVEYYASRCRALLFPGEEDFGMAPLEVAAAGRPAIAFRAGGAMETIVDGVTGLFFDQREARDLANAIERFEKQEWRPEILRQHAESFGIDVFQRTFRQFLDHVGCPVPEHSALPFVVPHLPPGSVPGLLAQKDNVPA
jgi:glycosyltransferase involved in cell wall biosynthesis